jgi:phosphonate transport system permease protein
VSFNPALPPQAPGHAAGFGERWQRAVSGVLFGRQPSFDASSPQLMRARERWANPVNRPSLRLVIWSLLLLSFLWWSWRGIEGDVVKLVREVADAQPIVEQFLDPDWSILSDAVDATIVTVQMSVIGILGASLLSLPFGLLAARNVSTGPVYFVTRTFLSMVRCVPDLVWAIIFVVIVGLGPFAGTLAIIVGTTGSFGKLYAEAIESVDPRPVDAVRATGAPNVSASVFAILPQAFPLILSYVLFYWESTVRNAAIFGLVGAGGIGQLIDLHLGLLRYDRLAVDVLCIFVAVVIIDRASAVLRARLL